MRVALATCLHKPEPDPDEELLVAALARAGLGPRVLAWDDPEAAWHEVDLCVLRSTWNYPHRPDDFLAWARRVAGVTRMLNPLPVLEDNYHKSYLARLAARGVAVVDTVHLARGAAPELAALLDERGWSRAVVKPAVSAASLGTWRIDRAEAELSQQRFTADVALRDTMVQPYLRGVEEPGERALIWIDGALTHAIRKTARFAGEHERVSEALAIADDERELAEAALAPLAARLLYARVDVVRDDAGAPRIMELELIEPSLYLAEHPPALARLVAAIVARTRE
ncbi:ATP-grasp domain-containing protein [Nannocystis punicea]|uniref:ATP-grasp domain-containing protein n=1 Tax=Nannocystis punicea TaxID=2995304 RepID=A0ABY7GV30_9BACT|nr:hypothetical protein [Nannocystis poenicansa]WAS90822.1 hypothetical protein O0S08_31930 [Nannocystis poenicansa]